MCVYIYIYTIIIIIVILVIIIIIIIIKNPQVSEPWVERPRDFSAVGWSSVAIA